jgi:hypothetical protein
VTSFSRSRHTASLTCLAALAIWLFRQALFSNDLPAGTDMLGFITRASENASWERVFSSWSPSGLGAPRQFGLDNILGAITIVTGSAVWTIKLVVVCTLFGSGAAAYLLAWRWFRHHAVALLAGLFYLTSQASITRWASGQLNLELATATMPLLVLLWVECVDAFSIRRAARLALVTAGLMFVRPDMVLYAAPFLALYILIRMSLSRTPRAVARSACLTTAVSVAAVVALVAFVWYPARAGVRPQWLSFGGLFSADDIVRGSLDQFQSLLGLGREIGYLAFTGQQTWSSYPDLPLALYYLAAATMVTLAYCALLCRRDVRTLYLAGGAVLAGFLAKGLRGPVAEPYEWATHHVTTFANLREPNRWLIFGSLAYSLLAALCLREAWVRGPELIAPRLRTVSLGFLVTFLFIPTAPTILRGFRTYEPPPGQLALFRTIAADHDQFAVATIPYDQSVRFLTQGSYRGWEHDLGAESALYTGHPAVADGGWNARLADLVAYTSTLLKRRDPAFEPVLGAIGVKYLVALSYPETAPHLIDPALGQMYQQHFIRSLPGFEPVLKTSGGTLYRLRDWSPALTYKPNLAVVLGGSSGLVSAMRVPGFRLTDWATVSAPDALATGGLPLLLQLIRRSQMVVVANEQLRDVAVLASRTAISASGITSDPGLERKSELLPSDASIRTGSMADPRTPAARTANSASITFRTPARGPYEIWGRVRSSTTAARLTWSIDERALPSVTPLAPVDGGFRWVAIGTVSLAAGAHRLDLGATSSGFGSSFEVDETRVISPRDRRRVETELQQALVHAGPHVVYAFDDSNAVKWSKGSVERRPGPVVGVGPSFWDPVDPGFVGVAAASAPAGRPATTVSSQAGRPHYTILEHRFSRPQDWSSRRYFFLGFRGNGATDRLQIFVDFGRDHSGSAVFSLPDAPGWETLAFDPAGAAVARDAWRHVVSVRIVGSSRDNVPNFDLGALRLGRTPSAYRVTVAITPVGIPRRLVARGKAQVVVPAGARTVSWQIAPADLDRRLTAVVVPANPPRPWPTVPLNTVRTGATTYAFSLRALTPGVLTLHQTFDGHWLLRSNDAVLTPIPVTSLSAGFLIPAGISHGSVSFAGERPARVGLAVSGTALLIVLGLAFSPVDGRRRQA